jgi:hypothetical protein
MNFLKEIYNYFFPLLTLKERVNLWCKSIGKSESYGLDLQHEDLDIIRFKKRKFRYFKK